MFTSKVRAGRVAPEDSMVTVSCPTGEGGPDILRPTTTLVCADFIKLWFFNRELRNVKKWQRMNSVNAA